VCWSTKLKQKQNKQTKINCNKKVIIKNIKKPNKTNKQKYQTKLIKAEQNKTNKTK
jgi:hypothetical protein